MGSCKKIYWQLEFFFRHVRIFFPLHLLSICHSCKRSLYNKCITVCDTVSTRFIYGNQCLTFTVVWNHQASFVHLKFISKQNASHLNRFIVSMSEFQLHEYSTLDLLLLILTYLLHYIKIINQYYILHILSAHSFRGGSLL